MFSERMPIQSSFISLTLFLPSSLPLYLALLLTIPLWTHSLFSSFLAVHPRNLWTIREEREKTARAEREGRFDKSLLVKRPPDCREKDEDEGTGGCDLRPMAEFLSDADCSRLLWMVIGELSLRGQTRTTTRRTLSTVKRNRDLSFTSRMTRECVTSTCVT